MKRSGHLLYDLEELNPLITNLPPQVQADYLQRFGDSTTLANWYYAHRATVPTVTTSRTNLMEAPVVATATDAAWTDKTVDVTIPGDQRELTVFDLAGDLAVSLDVATFDGAVNADDDAGTETS